MSESHAASEFGPDAHNDNELLTKTTTTTIVTELHPHDVLLGRLAATVNYQGNVRYRQVVRTRKAEYMSTGRHRQKDDIARQVMAAIQLDGGRSLSLTDEQRSGKMTWSIVSEEIALQKVKQALREELSSRECALQPSSTENDEIGAADLFRREQQPTLVGSERSSSNTALLGAMQGNSHILSPMEALLTRVGTVESSLAAAAAPPPAVSNSRTLWLSTVVPPPEQLALQQLLLQQDHERRQQLWTRLQMQQNVLLIEQQQHQLQQQSWALQMATAANNNPSTLATTTLAQLCPSPIQGWMQQQQQQQQHQHQPLQPPSWMTLDSWNGPRLGAGTYSVPGSSSSTGAAGSTLPQQQLQLLQQLQPMVHNDFHVAAAATTTTTEQRTTLSNPGLAGDTTAADPATAATTMTRLHTRSAESPPLLTTTTTRAIAKASKDDSQSTLYRRRQPPPRKRTRCHSDLAARLFRASGDGGSGSDSTVPQESKESDNQSNESDDDYSDQVEK
jgi:hypothetical protein